MSTTPTAELATAPKLGDTLWVQPQADRHMVDEGGKPYTAAPQRVTVSRYVLRALQFGDLQAVPEPAPKAAAAPVVKAAITDKTADKAADKTIDKPTDKPATK